MLAFKNNKVYYMVVALIYFFVFRDYAESINIPVVQYIDEFIAVLGIIIVFMFVGSQCKKKVSRSNVAMALLLGVFVLCGMMGGCVYGYQNLFVTLRGMFLSIKFWFSLVSYGYLVRFLDVPFYAYRLYRHLLVCACVLFGAQIIDVIFNIFPGEVRYGIKSCQLFYTHPTITGAVAAFLVAFILVLYPYTKKGFFPTCGLLLLMVLTLRSKTVAVAICFVGMYFFFVKLKGKLNLAIIGCGCITMLAVAWEQIVYYYDMAKVDTMARLALTVRGLAVATDHFPWGAGFGTFATDTSAVYYSPLYSIYAMTNIYGLTEGSADFVSDVFWPAIYAEAGYIGCAAYIGIVVLLYYQINKLRKENVYIYTAALFVLLYEIVESTAAAAFFHPTANALAFIIALALYGKYSLDKGNPYVEKTDGLSDASKEKLEHASWEDIVNADVEKLVK